MRNTNIGIRSSTVNGSISTKYKSGFVSPWKNINTVRRAEHEGWYKFIERTSTKENKMS